MEPLLINGDCLEVMKTLEDNSIDLVFCDLPYGQTSCSWDIKIDLEKFWKELNRITKETTPIFFTTTTRFGVELIMSNPKNFRYDIVWVKSASCGFMNAKKMPLRKHEMIYVFYRKLPFYDLTSHRHKFKDSVVPVKEQFGGCYNDRTFEYTGESRQANVYDPPLPSSVLQIRGKTKEINNDVYNVDERMISGKLYHYPRQLQKGDESIYEPPLPNSVLEIKSVRGKHATQKPTEIIKWILKYYSKEGDTILDPTMGSGSTGIACKEMNRKFIGIELDKEIFESAFLSVKK